MDWNNNRDITILRFQDRMKAEINKLKEDKKISRFHEQGVRWHKKKAAELRKTKEFGDLFKQVVSIDLTDHERMAAVLAADMES